MSASSNTDKHNNGNGHVDSVDDLDDIEEIAPGPIETSAGGYSLLDPLAGGKKYYRSSHHRIFVNRSLSLEKIKFFGFDMDYTIAEYKTPEFEALAYGLATKRLVDMGYPKILGDSSYDASFPIRGLWFDTLYGNFLKVDAYGNILVCVHGFKFLKTSEIFNIYPNKFVQMNDSRIYVLNTLFNQPETCLLGQVISYFSTNPEFDQSSPYGVKDNKANLFMPFKSMFQDVRNAFDKIHADGSLKKETVDNLEQYVVRDDRIPMLFDRMRENGKKVFLLTNSGYTYTDQIMSHLFSLPSCGSRSWTSYFDFIIVDARKPLFFGKRTSFNFIDRIDGCKILSNGSFHQLKHEANCRDNEVLYISDASTELLEKFPWPQRSFHDDGRNQVTELLQFYPRNNTVNHLSRKILVILSLLALALSVYWLWTQETMNTKGDLLIQIDTRQIDNLMKRYPDSISNKDLRVIKSRLDVMRREVSVLTLLGRQRDENCESDPTFCVARTIVNVTNTPPGYLDASNHQLNYEDLERELRESLGGSRNALMIDSLEKLPGDHVMHLFQFIDKHECLDKYRGMLLFVMYPEREFDIPNRKGVEIVEKLLLRKWSPYVPKDSLISVISRISASIVKLD